MSPENHGVFQLLEKVTFRRILACYSSEEWGRLTTHQMLGRNGEIGYDKGCGIVEHLSVFAWTSEPVGM